MSEPVKYELVLRGQWHNEGWKIKALRDIPSQGVKVGDLGGVVWSPLCLSQDGDCWVPPSGMIHEDARVKGNARIAGVVKGKGKVGGQAYVRRLGVVSGDARVYGNAVIYGTVTGHARVQGNAVVLLGGYVATPPGTLISGYTLVLGRITDVRLELGCEILWPEEKKR